MIDTVYCFSDDDRAPSSFAFEGRNKRGGSLVRQAEVVVYWDFLKFEFTFS